MAIYHCSLKTLSRSLGHSAVAAAAYRAGALLVDERSGITHRYHNRKGVVDAFICLPKSVPDVYQNRAVLWNAAEQADNRKNSRTARELVLALPHELSDAERRMLTEDMALWLIERYGVAVDSAIHAPVMDHGDDARNHHAHILFTTRVITASGLGKKTRILDDKVTGSAETLVIREVWETLLNDALMRAGFDEAIVDRRTLEEQGIDRTPQIHIGKKSKAAQDAEGRETASDDDDDDDGEGDTDSGKSGKGDSLPPKAEQEDASEDSIAAAEDTRMDKVYDQTDRGWRSDLVQEIKTLNTKRAAFEDIPLDQQILDLEHLMEKLDSRIDRLTQLKEKTSLSSQVKELLKQLFEFISRDKADISLVHKNRDIRAAQKAAQIKRYGRAYREGIHSQMRRMESYIEIVQQKQNDYAAYKSFVDEIEQLIAQEYKATSAQQITPATSKQNETLITTEESLRKLKLRGEFIKEHFREEGLINGSNPIKVRNAT